MIVAADLYRVQLPLVAPFRTAQSTTAVKDAVLVRVEDADGVFGWGECVAQVDRSYLPHNIDDCWNALRNYMLPALLVERPLQEDTPPPAAAALGCATTDAFLRGRNESLAAMISGQAEWIAAGVAVGRIDDVDEFARALHHYAEAGYRRVKCKIEPGHDIEPLTRARHELGPDIELAADANGSYTPAEATALIDAVSSLELQCIEQPCAEAVRLRVRTRVCLDESVRDVGDLTEIVREHTADAISVKPGRLGGLGPAKVVVQTAKHHGIDALPGGMLETGIGRAELLALASLPGFTMAGDISASDRYFGPDGDLTEPFVLEDGRIRVPTGPGLGVEPVPERLAACTVAHERITKKD